MITCARCGSEIPEESRFCLTCGSAVGALSMAPTRAASEGAARAAATGEDAGRAVSLRSGRPPSSDPSSHGRFTPGSLFGDRYRIVALLGRGGMGEVYRADDLRLGQPVALKLLPEAVASDAARLDRFVNEVRVARQVSHPNVCRVYDIGDVDGAHFLSMEYVDGEDLASLLRRIGRLPRDKGLDIARQLCAGIAAAHDRGVLHRDLKPANVMLDGRGRVRITDFGLAGFAETGAEIAAGTPAYMAPEQIEGKEVSVRSDLYALGVVLYELFTGKRPFDGGGYPEMARMHREATPTTPSSLIPEIDPAVESVILRCLSKDPRARPGSALAVAAALPGGDPLAAALAAGDTPSPEMVAAAGSEGGLAPRAAWLCLAAVIATLFVFAALAGRTFLARLSPMERSPDALEDRARQIAAKAGWSEKPMDTARGIDRDEDLLRWVERTDASTSRWNWIGSGRPAAITFWYRGSPTPMLPSNGETARKVSRLDPPMDVPGMVRVTLDVKGRLLGFTVVPPEGRQEKTSSGTVDWGPLLEEAGLDPLAFRPAEPQRHPPVFADARASWLGAFPERPDLPVRVEAASLGGLPVFFRVTGAWTTQGEGASEGNMVQAIVTTLVITGIVIAGLLLARRNLRLGRGDARGGLRVALILGVIVLASTILDADYASSLEGMRAPFLFAARNAVFFGVLAWLIYTAMEPYVRRRWPTMLISWSRAISGGLGDPMVGRDLLFGVLAGGLWSLVDPLYHLAPGWFDLPLQAPHPVIGSVLLGPRHQMAYVLGTAAMSFFFVLALAFYLVLLEIILRRRWLACVLFLVSGTLAEFTGTGNPAIQAAYAFTTAAIMLTLLARMGLLPALAASFTSNEILGFPMTADLQSWYAPAGMVGAVVVLALAMWGFRAALAGRPLFSGTALDGAA